MKPLPDPAERIDDPRGFTVTGHTLECAGICPQCQADSKKTGD
ncbi:MAG: hypothetical protein V1789_03015 [PVC group bacterium]